MDNFSAHIGPKTTPPPTKTITTSLREQPTLPLQDIHYNIALNGRSEGSKLISSSAKQSDPGGSVGYPGDRSSVDRQIADRPLGDRQTDECPLVADRLPRDHFTAELPRTEPVRTQGNATEAEVRALPSLHQTGSSLANPAETGYYYTGGSSWPPPGQSSEAAPCRTTSSSSSSSLHAPCGSWSPGSPSVGRNKGFFGSPGSGSGYISQRYGSGSGSFYHQAKIVRKTLIPTVL
jgi:hypothetical protein